MLSQNDLYLLTQCAVSAAYQAGALISSYTNKELSINKKTAGESIASQVFTEVDIKSQEIILQTLAPTLDLFDLALLTEESTDDKSRFEKEYFWCIDPLDGTLPFIEKTPGYAVSIALVSKTGIPVVGVIFNPATQDIFYASVDKGAFKNGKLIHINPDTPFSQTFHLFTDRSFVHQSHFQSTHKQLNEIADELGYKNIEINSQAGAAINACKVLENIPACYFKFPKKEDGGGSLWDYAATACIFKEAGAFVSDMHGYPLDLNRKDSTFMNHMGILYASNKELAQKILGIRYKI